MENQQKQFVLGLIAYTIQRDVAAEELCKRAAIDLSSLKKKPEYGITKKQIDDLWRYAGELTNDVLFGLHFGEALQLAALGAVGDIVKSSRTVGEGINIAASLVPMVTDLFTMEIITGKKTFAIKLNPSREIGMDFTSRQLADTLMAFTVRELDGLMLKKIAPRAVTIPYAIVNPSEYERVLRCRPSKHRAELSLQFDNKFLDEPVLSANYELQQLLLQKVTSATSKVPSGIFGDKIHHHLMSNAYLGILSLEDVAANFNITPRSLQRRLSAEGITFQHLSDSVRKSLALHYIQSGKHQIKEISDMLGYHELSAFSRAFKRWTGKPPVSYLS